MCACVSELWRLAGLAFFPTAIVARSGPRMKYEMMNDLFPICAFICICICTGILTQGSGCACCWGRIAAALFLQFPFCQNSIECGHVLQTYVSIEQLFNAHLINLNTEKAIMEKGSISQELHILFIGIRVAILCNHLKKQRWREKRKRKHDPFRYGIDSCSF